MNKTELVAAMAEKSMGIGFAEYKKQLKRQEF